MNQELIQYLQQQIRTTDERLKRFTHDMAGKKYPRRHMFVKLQHYINAFLNKKAGGKMIIVPGFRGVGKTTLMAQICAEYKNKVGGILFLSVEDANNLFNVGIAGLMSAYENILGHDLEKTSQSLLIFLDEIQSDPKWAVTLKSLFEKTSNIFFCCTGSSAVILQTTTDLARRAIFEKLPPLSFTEFKMIRDNLYPPGLKDKIKQAMYFSKNAKEVYDNLAALQPAVHQYWLGVNRHDIRDYLAYGTLPFSLLMPNETAVYDSISLLLDKIIKSDLPALGHFDMATLGAVKRIIFAIAEREDIRQTSLEKLADELGINRLTIASIFSALEKAELFICVPAYGSNTAAAKKPKKYLFMSPAIRMSFFYITGQESTYLTRQGRLLEDSIGAHLHREFILGGQGAMRYDSAKGGADFILQISNKRQIIIEVGMGNKGKKQIANSMKKINSEYNLIISSSSLEIDEELNTIFIPLEYYFLL